MSKLLELNNLNADNFIDIISNEELLIFENILGSKVFFQYTGEEFVIRTRNISNTPLNKVDLSIQKYYKPLYNYLEGLDERVKKLLPKKWLFGVQYFYDTQPSTVKYDRIPKNNMILVSIFKNNNYTCDYDELNEFASLLDIDVLPVLFKGKLNTVQVKKIVEFLKTSKKDIEYIFGEENFTSFFYKILNPQLKNSFLMDTYTDNLDKIIIKTKNDELSFSILNPMHYQNNSATSFSDDYSILLIEFLEFFQLYDLKSLDLKSNNADELYLEILCEIFNAYCKSRIDKIINFDFIIPSYYAEDKFKINTEYLKNHNTLYLIKKSPKLEYFLKVILSAFRNKKTKIFGVFDENSLKLFNLSIDNIQKVIDTKLKLNIDLLTIRKGLLDFKDFFDIKYSTDAEGRTYGDSNTTENDDSDVSIDNKKKK